MLAEVCMKSIGAGETGGLWLFYGKEEYLKDLTLEKLRQLLIEPAMRGLDDQLWEGERPLDEILAALDTPPFLSRRRLIVIRDDPRVVGKGADAKDFEKIEAHLNPGSCLVFLCRTAPDASSAWVKAMKKADVTVEFRPLKAAEARPWIARMAREAGGSISAGAAEYLFDFTGGSLTAVQSEMEKLCALCAGRPIGRADIEAICIPSAEFRVFTMLDALMMGQKERAMALYNQALETDESPAGLLSLLSGQIRVARYALEGQREGMSAEELASALDVRPFVAEKAPRIWRNTPVSVLISLQEACAQADRDFKQGIRGDREALETVIFRLLER